MTGTERISWVVRRTTTNDADAVDELLKVSYQTLLPNDYDSDLLEKALPLITKAQPILLSSGSWYLVEHPETGTVVGCGGWNQSPTKQTNALHLRHFSTHPQYTRQGVAKCIWNRIRSDIVEEFGKETDLEVYSTLTAQPFYASLGFEPIETVHLPLHPDFTFPSVLMRRSGKPLES